MAADESSTQVVVVGAGPVGLMLAGELRLGGAEVAVLDRLAAPTTESRASTLHARTMELLDARGLVAGLGDVPVLAAGHFGGIGLDLTLPSRFSGQWKVPQTRTEELLGAWAVGLGAEVRRGWEVQALSSDADGVEIVAVTPAGRRRVRASYVVACDGEDSVVRTLIGAAFPGQEQRREMIRADVAGVTVPDRRFERLDAGLAIASRNPAGVTRVMVHEFGREAPERHDEPDFAEVVDVWKRVTGEDLSGGTPLWINAFGDTNQQLAAYRHGRVLFAGDAAHRQLPSGGQALNLGLQDAVNLGWKLALQVRERPPDDLLDTYHAERHAVGTRVLANVRAQGELLLGGPEIEPVRALLTELVAVDAIRVALAGMISGLDVRYDVGPGDHPLLGARLPHLELTTPDGPATTTHLLRAGRGLMLDFTADRPVPMRWIAGLWDDRVTAVVAEPAEAPEGAAALLVRPDGHVGWVGSEPPGAIAAMRRWFGPARATY